jgi:4-hydroxybenzoate polyprenyltransferase
MSFGLLYGIVFKKITRKIIAFKNLYVSAFFASLVFFPIIYYGINAKILGGAIIFAIFVFLKSMIMQIFLDIKDIKADKKEKLRTIPVLLKKQLTLKLLKILTIIITFVPIVLFAFVFNVLAKVFILLILTVPFNFCCFTKAQNDEYLGYILEGGEFLLWAALIGVGQLLFILL